MMSYRAINLSIVVTLIYCCGCSDKCIRHSDCSTGDMCVRGVCEGKSSPDSGIIEDAGDTTDTSTGTDSDINTDTDTSTEEEMDAGIVVDSGVAESFHGHVILHSWHNKCFSPYPMRIETPKGLGK